jgi:predicted ATPase
LIDSLLSDHGDLTILATSRLVLHVLGEFVYVIPTYDEGERLFAERCNAHGVPLASSFAREDASVISELVDHLPLAIELAASYIRFRSTSEIIDSLREGEIVESQWMQVPRHRSFDAALSASLELLSLEQRTACRRLAECEVNFTFERAASIVGVDECRPLLNELIDQSLIDLLRTAEGSTYRMLTPIRHAMLRTAP